MNLARRLLQELLGLFVDDGCLAIAILGVVTLAIMFAGVDAPLPVTGGILFFGCAIVLAWSVMRARKP